jgi:hypothetical protein
VKKILLFGGSSCVCSGAFTLFEAARENMPTPEALFCFVVMTVFLGVVILPTVANYWTAKI